MNALSALQILQLVGFAFLLATGQMLFKKTAMSVPPLLSVEGITALAFNPWFWLALVLYGTATLLWILILQSVPLSLAYPFVALGFIIIPLASWFLFKETLTLSYALGAALIIAGLGVIAATGRL